MSPTAEANDPNPSGASAEVSPTRRAVIGTAGVGIISAALPSAASAASAGGAEGVSSGTGIIASVVQGPSNTAVAPTAISVSGVNYNVYRFTQNGSFSVSGGSLNADVLLIGGGGGGGGGYAGGGGGGGEVLPLTSKSFVAGNYDVTIGQGGAAGTSLVAAGDGNPSKVTYGTGAVSPGSTWESEARKGLKGIRSTEGSSGNGGTSGDQFAGGLYRSVPGGMGGGGGGGSTGVGTNGDTGGGAGGPGETVTGYWSSALSIGGGGGGGGYVSAGSASNGGGAGGRSGGGFGAGTAGTAGTGGGGGGGYDGNGGAGGSGAIYIRILA